MSKLSTSKPKFYKTLVTSVLALSLSACATVGPDYQAIEHEPNDLSNIHGVEIGKRDAHWWKLFNDHMLNMLIEATLKK